MDDFFDPFAPQEPEIDVPPPEPYYVYVQTDESDRITSINSSAFVNSDWGTEIDSGYSDKHHHAQGNYFSDALYTNDGIPRYKLVDGHAQERTTEEISADIAAIPMPPPTEQEQIRADIDFIAAMTGVDL